jgi:thioredoxin-like negative regulator of GroEL
MSPLLDLVGAYWSLPWEERDQRASVVSMVFGGVSMLLAVVSIMQNRRLTSATELATSATRSRSEFDLRSLPRMRTLSPRRARVHEAVPLAGDQTDFRPRWSWRATGTVLDPDLPLFVPRELGPHITDRMRRARREGGFMLVLGTSSVGKTRLLLETARRELGDFRVLVPDLGDGGAVNALAEAKLKGPVVVWLDELQRFLPGPYFVSDDSVGHVPVTASALRRLLDRDISVVVLATLWPVYARQLRARTTEPDSRPLYPKAVDILDHVTVDLTLTGFSADERQEAAELAVRDPRLAVAVADPDHNVTETLAGVPRILRRYHQAVPEYQAIVHAAIDARRVGIQGPLVEELLREAGRGYLTHHQPDDTWFSQGLAELTRTTARDDAATAPLLPVLTSDARYVLGYAVHDYLLQYLQRRRRAEPLNEVTWRALGRLTCNHDDRMRLARGADMRMQYRHALVLYRTLANSDAWAATRLAELLARQNNVRELRARTEAGDGEAAFKLGHLLIARGEVREAVSAFRASVEAGNGAASLSLHDLLVQHGDVEEKMAVLRADADAGSGYAASRLADLLVAQGKAKEAVILLGAYLDSDAGDDFAAYRDDEDDEASIRLAGLLAELGWVDELRDRADAGDGYAAARLAELWLKQGRLDDLRARADAGDSAAALRLAEYLGAQEELDELRVRADAGDYWAVSRLTTVLIDREEIEDAVQVLRARVNAGDHSAASRLAELFVERGEFEQAVSLLRDRASAGDNYLAVRLAELLAKHGRTQEAMTIFRVLTDARDTHDDYAASRLADLLASQGEVAELQVRADTGDHWAASQLVDLLAAQGMVEEIRVRAGSGDPFSVREFAAVLARQGNMAELRTRADAGDHWAATELIDLLAARDAVDELRDRANAGDGHAAARLAELLADQGRIDELRVRADGGDHSAARQLVELLISRSDQVTLCEEVHAGTAGAAEGLINLLHDHGRDEDAVQLRVWGMTSAGSPSTRWQPGSN